MNSVDYIFDTNCMTLYYLWENKSIKKLMRGNYSSVIERSDPKVLDQYRFWLHLSEDRRKQISQYVEHGEKVIYKISSNLYW